MISIKNEQEIELMRKSGKITYGALSGLKDFIKPGITGMWQVSGRSDITDFEEVVRLDNKYIAEWNLRLDIKIIIKTIGVVLGSKGSV